MTRRAVRVAMRTVLAMLAIGVGGVDAQATRPAPKPIKSSEVRRLPAGAIVAPRAASGPATRVATRAASQPASQPASTRAAASRSTTASASAEAVHAQAVELMRQGQWAKARPLIDQAYDATPPAQRTRPLILNRALLDATQRTLALRALRELEAYLTRHRAADEFATNVLGVALQAAAVADPRAKQSKIWQDALREWDRRNYLMDTGRPGYRRWGVKWLSDEQYADMAEGRRDLERDILDQQERYDRAAWRLANAQDQVQNLRAEAEMIRKMVPNDSYMPNAERVRGRARAGRDARDVAAGGGGASMEASRSVGLAQTRAGLMRAERELQVAQGDASVEAQQLQRLLAQRPKPDWPKTLPPVDPAERTAPPMPPPDPKAAAEKDEKLRAAGRGGATTMPTTPFDPREIDGGPPK